VNENLEWLQLGEEAKGPAEWRLIIIKIKKEEKKGK